MSNRLSYTEMIAEVSTPLTPISVTKLIGSGTIISISANMFYSLSFDMVAHADVSFFSSSNPSGTPLGTIVTGPVSLLSGLRWDGRVFVYPDMSIALTVSSTAVSKIALSILVEHEKKE